MSRQKVKVTCKFCGSDNYYFPRKSDKNRKTAKIKKCSSCNKRFKITLKASALYSNLDKLEKDILSLIASGKATFCVEIAHILKTNNTKIWRKLQYLEKIGKIKAKPKSSAKFYDISSGNVIIPPKHNMPIQRLHNVKFKCDLVEIPKNFQFDKVVFPKGWTKRIKNIKDWKVEVNKYCVVFDYRKDIYTYNFVKEQKKLKDECGDIRDYLVSQGFKLGNEITYTGDPSKPKSHVAVNIQSGLGKNNVRISDEKGHWIGIDESTGENETDLDFDTAFNFFNQGNAITELKQQIKQSNAEIKQTINQLTEAIKQMSEEYGKSINELASSITELINPFKNKKNDFNIYS